jgi:hypothetical protein
MIRTIREELLDQVLFWNQLERKLSALRVMAYPLPLSGLISTAMVQITESAVFRRERGQRHQRTLRLSQFRWRPYHHSLFELPAAA